MRITGKDLACGTVSYCEVDKKDFCKNEAPKMGYKKEKASRCLRIPRLLPLRTACVYISLPLPLYEISNIYIGASGPVKLFPGVVFLAFLRGARESFCWVAFCFRVNVLGVARHLRRYGVNREWRSRLAPGAWRIARHGPAGSCDAWRGIHVR